MNAAQLRFGHRGDIAVVVTSVVGVIAFGWPFLAPRVAISHPSTAPWIFVAVVALLLATVIAEVSAHALDAKAVALLGVLAGIGAVLRPMSGGASGFTFEFLLVILAGRVLGRGFGFLLGALTLLASALLTAGVGPWLPYQMLATAWVGFGAGCLPALRGKAEVLTLAAYGAVSGLAYGLLLNLSFWPFAHYYPAQIAFLPHATVVTNLVHWWRFDVTTSLGFDVPRAVGNAVLVVLLGRPVMTALHRAARRAFFTEQPTGAQPAVAS